MNHLVTADLWLKHIKVQYGTKPTKVLNTRNILQDSTPWCRRTDFIAHRFFSTSKSWRTTLFYGELTYNGPPLQYQQTSLTWLKPYQADSRISQRSLFICVFNYFNWKHNWASIFIHPAASAHLTSKGLIDKTCVCTKWDDYVKHKSSHGFLRTYMIYTCTVYILQFWRWWLSPVPLNTTVEYEIVRGYRCHNILHDGTVGDALPQSKKGLCFDNFYLELTFSPNFLLSFFAISNTKIAI